MLLRIKCLHRRLREIWAHFQILSPHLPSPKKHFWLPYGISHPRIYPEKLGGNRLTMILTISQVGSRDLRNPITPPVTSLEEAMVISLAGTNFIDGSSERRDTLTKRLSETLTLKPSENTERSETPSELVGETLTIQTDTPKCYIY